MRIVVLYLALAASSFLNCFGQVNEYFIAAQESYVKDTIYLSTSSRIFSDQKITAVKIKSLTVQETVVNVAYGGIEKSVLAMEDDHLEFPQNFFILLEPSNALMLNSNWKGLVQIELFYAGMQSVENSNQKYKAEDCVKPTVIPPSTWREGLDNPVPGRNTVTVKHCIIHHAASNNAHTDFTYVVRNIYLLHTQSNGWDDIGYNYLVAPNGDVYIGRDPLGVADEDNIQGAHFCSKNGGTMGVCLIGDYTKTQASDTMIGSLIDLLAWKLFKEQISAYDKFPHPLNSSPDLNSIAMHKQGCSTVCPGDSIADRIEEIRTKVQFELNKCNRVGVNELNLKNNRLYPNPTNGHLHLKGAADKSTYRVLNTYGQLIDNGLIMNEFLDLSHLQTGHYYLEIFSQEGIRAIHSIILSF
ncbi:MAG: N-acetylmuramoyl-L-alanine amidase [Bacteroidia bacterium]